MDKQLTLNESKLKHWFIGYYSNSGVALFLPPAYFICRCREIPYLTSMEIGNKPGFVRSEMRCGLKDGKLFANICIEDMKNDFYKEIPIDFLDHEEKKNLINFLNKCKKEQYLLDKKLLRKDGTDEN